MAPWGPLQRQLLTYLARHPQFQKAVKDAGQRVTTHPTFQKAKQRAYATFEKASEKTARGAGTGGQGSAGGAGESTFNKWKRRSADQWQKHMVKAVSFIFANIMTLLVVIQFGPMIWHFCKRGVHYLTSPPSNSEAEQGERRRRKKKEGDAAEAGFHVEAPDDSMRKAILQSVPQPVIKSDRATETASPVAPPAAPSPSQWGHSSSLFDDTVSSQSNMDLEQTFNDMHKDVFRTSDGDVRVNFNTSFLVKMGDETTFTSSLEREALTGGAASRS